MVIKSGLAAALLSLTCMSAFAQATFSARSTGTLTRDVEISGLVSAMAGTPFTLEVTSVFPENVAWLAWPDWIDTSPVQSTALLTIGGVTHEYSGLGRMGLEVREEPQGDVADRKVVYIVTLPVTQAQAGFSFGTHFYLAPESGDVTLMDLFESGQDYPVSEEARNTSSLWLAPAGQSNAYHLPINATSFSYDTSGVPVATAVPEPSTAAMLLAGMALLGAGARRRRR